MIRVPHRRASLLSQLGLGVLAYRLVFRPLNRCTQVYRQGLWSSLQTYRGKRAMRSMAAGLPPLRTRPINTGARVTFLTGSDYWWQTIWCAHTLVRHTGNGVALEFVDDGTLREGQASALCRLFPDALLVPARERERQLVRVLPPTQFPLLWFYRRTKPIFRKLTDIFGRDDHWRLLLDSDMLFFRPPSELLRWLAAPDRPCYMVDVHSAYGYSLDLMTRLAGGSIPDRVNIGIFGFSGQLVDWPRVECWLHELIEAEGLQYNLTQAIAAMHLASRATMVLPPEDYLLLPTRAQAEEPAATLQHYVAESKEWYLRFAWRRAAARLPAQVLPR